MKAPFILLLLLSAASFTGCATGPSDPLQGVNRVAVPDEAARQKALAEADKQRRKFETVLIKLDQAMETYAQALANRGSPRADTQAENVEKLIRDLVTDRGSQVFRKPVNAEDAKLERVNEAPTNYFERLRAAAIDGTHPHYQGIALAALGFSARDDVMPIILQGAQLDDPLLVDRAIFGLAILRAPDTPPGVIGAVIDDRDASDNSRAAAAWALYRLQERSNRESEIVEIWRRLAGRGPGAVPAGALVQALRGLGLTRDKKHAGLVAPFLDNNVPLLRMAAAGALARMNAQEHAPEIIDLLGPAESVPNVRLHARKALQALAGDLDYGYDVDAWRKAFERK